MLYSTRLSAKVAPHIVQKTQRWALQLSEFKFTVEHILGELNTWADFLTRWADFPARRISAFRVLLITGDLPELPSLEAIAKSQTKSLPATDSGYSSSLTPTGEIWMDKAGKIFVREDDVEKLLRICLTAHCGLGGHRGLTTTSKVIKYKLRLTAMDADNKGFVRSCLVSTLSGNGSMVPRPLVQQIHATRASELLHFDFLYMGDSPLAMSISLSSRRTSPSASL